MCGIFGLVFPRGVDPASYSTIERLANSLAVLSAERGTDSSGIAFTDLSGEVHRFRVCKPGYHATQKDAWQQTFSHLRATTFAVLGHTRKKSVGSVCVENAMPHCFITDKETLCGVHNGTITHHTMLGPTPAYENDSANLFWGLASVPNSDHDIITFLKRVTGSYALAWTRGAHCYLTKTYCASLFRSWLPELEAHVFASTEHILNAACALNGLSLDTGAQRIFSSQLLHITPMSTGRGLTTEEFYPTSKFGGYQSGEYRRICGVCHNWGGASFNREIVGTFVCDNCYQTRFNSSWTSARDFLRLATSSTTSDTYASD